MAVRCGWKGHYVSVQFVQTSQEVYAVLTEAGFNLTEVYDTNCRLRGKLQGLGVRQILCDRGVCSSNTVHAITHQNTLISMLEDRKFTPTHLVTLSEEVVGAVVRQRGRDKLEIFVGERTGWLRVYDEEGAVKLSLRLEGGDRLAQLTDHHPYPLLLAESGWLSMLDTVKYQEVRQNCPFVPGLTHLLSDNYYSDSLLAVSP